MIKVIRKFGINMTAEEKIKQIESIIEAYDAEELQDEEMLVDFIKDTLKGKVVRFGIEVDPECTAPEEEKEESEIECEFNKKNGQWWCSTHNCPA
jgi:hypothetical protein